MSFVKLTNECGTKWPMTYKLKILFFSDSNIIYEKDKNEFMKCKNCKVELKKNIIKNNYIAFISKKIKTYCQMKLICEKGHCPI